MLRTRHLLGLLVAACVTHGRPFNNSSVDFNGGRFHRLQTPGELETVADAVVAIMEESNASLVKRRTTKRQTVVLSFRQSIERAAGTTTEATSAPASSEWFPAGTFNSETATRADYLAYGAFFYVELTRLDEGGVEVSAVGLPVVDGLTSCPQVVSPYRECRPEEAPGPDSFSDHVERVSDISVTGEKEAEVLTGLLAQLQRKKWQDRFKVPAASAP
ncbi:MAG: hypothetical protein IT380_20860 [Myxococcales bacterium]|nr:hypothetical protein [Myxococcales bacterium]